MILAFLASGLIALAPLSGAVAKPAPTPSPAVSCPPVEYRDGVPVIPEGAPSDCVYITGAPGAPVEPPVEVPAEASPIADPSGSPTTADGAPRLFRALISAVRLGDGDEIPVDGWIEMGDDGGLTLSVGCNIFFTKARLERGDIILEAAMAVTKMRCADLEDAEAAVSAIADSGRLVIGEDGLSSPAGLLRTADALAIDGGEPVAPSSGDLLPALLVAVGGAAVVLLLLRRRRPPVA